ncbi:adenylate/guanylate cyclase domain-containing protein [soil metagenome]
MICTACGSDNKAGRQFCSQCGCALSVVCAACGFANEPADQFCGGCGTTLRAAITPAKDEPPESELRPVAVLFADLTGFTALSTRLNPDEVQSILKEAFAAADAAVVEAGGRVDKHIGDCVMAVFGIPAAHDDDCARAVSAACRIRDAVRDYAARARLPGLDVHSGIAAGLVAAGDAGSALHRSYTVTGTPVNLAARLCDRAEAGQILASADVAVPLAARFRFAPLGNFPVAGFASPVGMYLYEDEHTEIARPAGAIVGRNRELRLFDAALATVLEDGKSQIVVLRGDAGLGKTRLVEDMIRRAGLRGMTIHTAGALSFGGSRESEIPRVLFRSLAQSVPADGARFTPREEALAAELGGAAIPEHLRAVHNALDAIARRKGRAEVLAKLLKHAATASPLLIVVEDLHWADTETTELLADVLASLGDFPAAIILTTRPDGDPMTAAWRTGLAHVAFTLLDLLPLDAAEAEKLAFLLDPRILDAKRLVDRAGGNPLFLVQLLHHLGDAAHLPLPASIRSLIGARLDKLEERDRRTLSAAATLGMRCTETELAYMLDPDPVDIGDLVARHLLRRTRDGLEFVHVLVRESVYDTIGSLRRRQLHARAATWFSTRDKALRAQHLDLAGDPGAAQAYGEAADAEWNAYRHDQALDLNARALALADEGDAKTALAIRRGEMLAETGKIAESLSVWVDALAGTADPSLRCRALIGYAHSLRSADRLAEAEEALEEAQSIAEALLMTKELSRIHHTRGNIAFPRGKIAACLSSHRKAYDLAREAGSIEAEIRALGGLGDAYYVSGRMKSAYDAFTQCTALAREHGYGRIEIANLPMCAGTAFSTGRPQDSMRYNDEALQLAEQAQMPRAKMIAHHTYFLLLFEMDRIAESRRHVDAADEIAISLGTGRFQAESQLFFAEIANAEGDREAARAHARQALRLSEETGMSYMGPMILGMISDLAEDEAERIAAIKRASDILAEGAVAHNHLFFYGRMIDQALRRAAWAEVETWASALEDFFRDEQVAFTQFAAGKGRALARFGAGERSLDLLGDLEMLRDMGRTCDYRRGTKALEEAWLAFPRN